MNFDVLKLTAGAQPIAETLGYEIGSVLVDNFTSSYLSLPDAGRTLPPWVYGAVVNLPAGLRQARAKLLATKPAIEGPPVPTSECTLTWTDAVIPASAGHLLQQPIGSGPALNRQNLVDQGPFTLHVNMGPVTPAAPYTLWHLSAGGVLPNTDLIIHSWNLSFDGASAGAFASLVGTNQIVYSAPTSNGPEIWNQDLDSSKQSQQHWDPALLAPATSSTVAEASDLQFQAPISASNYNVRGTMVIELISRPVGS